MPAPLLRGAAADPLGAGHHDRLLGVWKLGRDFDSESEVFFDTLRVIVIAIIPVYMVMAAPFESALLPTAVLSAIIHSAVGALAFPWATDTPLTMMEMTGMVLLADIVVNNAIVLLNRTRQVAAADGAHQTTPSSHARHGRSPTRFADTA